MISHKLRYMYYIYLQKQFFITMMQYKPALTILCLQNRTRTAANIWKKICEGWMPIIDYIINKESKSVRLITDIHVNFTYWSNILDPPLIYPKQKLWGFGYKPVLQKFWEKLLNTVVLDYVTHILLCLIIWIKD